MKQPEVFKKIGGIIQELNEQYEYLQSTSDNLNDLELELFVANTHFLKDHAEILRKLNLIKSAPAQLPPHTEGTVTRSYILPPPPFPSEVPSAGGDNPSAEVKRDPIELWPVEIKPEPAEEKPAPATNEPRYFEPLVQQKPVDRPSSELVTPVPAPKEPISFEIAKPSEEETTPKIDLQSSTEDTYSFERREPETIRHELVLDDTQDWEDEEETPANDEELLNTEYIIEPQEQVTEAEEPIPTNPEPVIDNSPKVTAQQTVRSPVQPEYLKPPVAEEKPLSLNQRIAAQLKEQGAATSQTSQPPIQDIKAAINLNDKMLFVKDLFNGYPLAYSEAIEIVNRFKNFEEADRFLKTNYVIKNNWEAKQSTADKFYALLKRRYA